MSIGNNVAVAEAIRLQIGHKAFMMMGAKNFFATGPGLQFDVGKNCMHITRIIVTLDPSDTYTVKFYKGKGLTLKEIKSVSDVYVESLRMVLSNTTGLYLSL